MKAGPGLDRNAGSVSMVGWDENGSSLVTASNEESRQLWTRAHDGFFPKIDVIQ